MKNHIGLLFLVLLSGCVNLSAITDYADSAKSVVGATDVAKRWQSSEKMLVNNNRSGDSCSLARPNIDQKSRDNATTGIIQIHTVLSQYFDAVGKLASDKTPTPVTVETDAITRARAAGMGINANQEKAIQSVAAVLTRALDGYRQKKLKELMEQTDSDVSTSIDALLALVPVYKSDLDSEKRILVQWITKCEAVTTDPAVGFLVRREEERILTPYTQASDAIDQYQKALIQIKEKHKEILEALKGDRKTLEDTLKALNDARKELDAAKAAINTI
jgi:hypothetical protein